MTGVGPLAPNVGHSFQLRPILPNMTPPLGTTHGLQLMLLAFVFHLSLAVAAGASRTCTNTRADYVRVAHPVKKKRASDTVRLTSQYLCRSSLEAALRGRHLQRG